ncbi:MAG: glutamine-hydrolyzing carbamoyl-phosphate synthase small subunit [Candidatus Omnitrophica bacterium]|nr:glutamine-hydrolyzing carbamoyl-phosphate synthase small subunit [Candidatus Omnitrophota bacterium]
MGINRAKLVLEDETVFEGKFAGAGGEAIGKVIFNTGVVGYQEVITDPSNVGKIIVFTYPLIGNYGVSPKFNESERIWCQGLVIKEKSRIFSNWQAKESLECFLERNRTIAITDVDTRTLMVHLREKGEMGGIIASENSSVLKLLRKIESFKKRKSSFLEEISIKKKRVCGKQNAKTRIGILDLGLTKSIISQWENLGVQLILLPYRTSFEELRDLKLNGLIISHGPEEDLKLLGVVENIRPLIGKIPLLGISTGFHVLAEALGLKLKKMKLGHRGLNYPLMRPGSQKGEITVQNHVWVVDRLEVDKKKELKITGYNLNDQTIEEIESKKLKLIGIEYYPLSLEAGKPHPIFTKFLRMTGR